MKLNLYVTKTRSSQAQRRKALELAVSYHSMIEDDDLKDLPPDVVETARQFYRFLMGH